MFFNQAKLTDHSAVEAEFDSLSRISSRCRGELCPFPLERLDGNSHSVWPRHTEAGILEATAFVVISLDTSLQVNKCSFWVVKPVTLNSAQWRNRTFASGRFASCSALWSIFWRHGNATKIEVTWEKSVEVGQNINWNDNSKNCCNFSCFLFWQRKKSHDLQSMEYLWSHLKPFVVNS